LRVYFYDDKRIEKKIWEEAAVACSKHYSGTYLNGLRKTGVTEIRTENLPNTSCTSPLGPEELSASVFRVLEVTSTPNVKAAGWSGRDWIHLAQDRDQLRTLVNTAMYFRSSINVSKLFSS
jgi:hypothetical protein